MNKETIEEIACKKYSIKEGLEDYDEKYYNGTNVNLAKAFIEGHEYSKTELQDKDVCISLFETLVADLNTLLQNKDKEIEMLSRGISQRESYISKLEQGGKAQKEILKEKDIEIERLRENRIGILDEVQFIFEVQSDFSTHCNGYHALLRMIKSEKDRLTIP